MLDEETSEEVEEDGTDTSMKRSRLSGRRARKRKEQGGGKIKEENDSQLLTNSFSQVPTPPFSLFVIGMEPCLVKGEGDKEKMVVPLLVWMDIREGETQWDFVC
ncbi:hypothetical protein CK203_066835 [Vitis vinifera]|uniref:Uncharacterized protein n=1 Tax=Vitis vinifera TaxID=29760 RepID=A0A438EVC5_VITVI|nr:hypothetical protein CK203_066835 [Vitis vinifera]